MPVVLLPAGGLRISSQRLRARTADGRGVLPACNGSQPSGQAAAYPSEHLPREAQHLAGKPGGPHPVLPDPAKGELGPGELGSQDGQAEDEHGNARPWQRQHAQPDGDHRRSCDSHGSPAERMRKAGPERIPLPEQPGTQSGRGRCGAVVRGARRSLGVRRPARRSHPCHRPCRKCRGRRVVAAGSGVSRPGPGRTRTSLPAGSCAGRVVRGTFSPMSSPDAVDSLGPQDRGRWLVTTRGSRHLWDLDAGTYQRIPGEGRSAFPHDSAVVRITHVERWPKVGSTSLVWFDDPERPWETEHWRQCSTIESIEPAPDDETAQPHRD